MLVLQRKVGQRIFVGQNVVVEIVDLRGDRIKVGITAPRDFPVFREELLSEEQREALPSLSLEGEQP